MDSDVIGAAGRYFEALTAPDAEAFAALFNETAEVRDPVGAPPLSGPAGMTKFHGRLHRAWGSLQMAPVEAFPRGREVAVRWRASGVSASGKAIAFEGINTFVFGDGGRIERLDAFWDLEAVIAQM